MNNLYVCRKSGPWVFQGHSANDFYHQIVATIRLEGEAAAPRGLSTTELLHVVTRIDQPRRRVLTQYGRKLNPFFNLAETVWMLTGHSEAEWICFYNTQLRKYLDPPLRHFHGAYGERIRHWPWVTRLGYAGTMNQRDQLVDCYQVLRDAPDSRQAVMVLWNPGADHAGRLTLDRPCNDAVAFKVRSGALWVSVFNRSNDVVLGLTSTNIVQFSTLQEVLAAWLGVDVGPYTHYSDSLHLYDSQEVGVGPLFDIYEYVVPTPMAHQTPGQFDAALAQLYSTMEVLIKGNGLPTATEEVERTEYRWLQPSGLLVECPYWRSTAWALLAYIYHKQKNGAAATRCVGRMLTPDWQVECLRFLADRYGEEEGFIRHATTILTALSATGGLAGRQAVWGYIFQSHPGMGWSSS